MFKKLFYAFFLIAFTAVISPAQNFTLGVKGGASMIRMDFEKPVYIFPYYHSESPSTAEYKTAYGYTFGLTGTYRISELISIEADILYELKGTKYGIEQESFPGYMPAKFTYTYNLNYAAVPLLAKIYLPLDSDFKPHAVLGASFDFLLNSNMSYTVERDPRVMVPGVVMPSDFDLNSKTNSFDLGLVGGVGADYSFASGILSLEALYELGTANLDKGMGFGPVNNRTFSVLLGYSFRL
ncbi:MAG TPA: porin family protein [Ignavibacteriales bacterium]|nr:porin family protein [Ignavibacteriales bacterium]